MTSEALKVIDSQLECAVCLQAYTDPKLLSCFHAFCRPCLEGMDWQDHGGAGPEVACPKCRQTTTASRDGIGGLQSAYHIHHLFDVRDLLRKTKETQCEKCNDTAASDFCHDCGKVICEKCIETHHKWDELTSHRIVSIDDIGATATGPGVSKGRNCSRHPDSTLKLYCETCQELICTDCTIRLHQEHQFDLVTDTFPAYREELQVHLQTLRQQLRVVNDGLCNFDREMNGVRDNRLAVEAEIDERISQLHDALEQSRQELVDQLNCITQEKLKSLAAQRDRIEMLQTQVASCLEYVENTLKTGTEGEVVAMKAPVDKQVKQLADNVDPDTLNPLATVDPILVEYDANRHTETCRNFAVIKTINLERCYATASGLNAATVGDRVDIRLHTKDKNGSAYDVQTCDITVGLTCCEREVQARWDIKKVKEGEFSIRCWPSAHGKHQLSIMIWGRHIKGSPRSVVIQHCSTNYPRLR